MRVGSSSLGRSGLVNRDATEEDGTPRPEFIPGTNGSFYWNTTVPVDEKPILVYLYNGHVVDDTNASFSKHVERECFRQKKIAEVARGFVCEKICFGCDEFFRWVTHRGALEPYLHKLKKPDANVTSLVVLLDSSGSVIREFKKPPSIDAMLSASR